MPLVVWGIERLVDDACASGGRLSLLRVRQVGRTNLDIRRHHIGAMATSIDGPNGDAEAVKRARRPAANRPGSQNDV